MACTETGAQLLARLGSRPDISEISPQLFPSGIKMKDVVEFYGNEGTGKTEMLLHLVASIIMPKYWSGLELNGADAAVMFIDTDYKFSILRLVTLLEKKVNQAQEEVKAKRQAKKIPISKRNDETAILKENVTVDGTTTSMSSCENVISSEHVEKFIKDCLRNISVVYCNSSSQLLLTLHNLENSVSNNPNICVIMIDSISAFYWIDKCNGGESSSLQETNLNRIVSILSELVNNCNLTLFATKHALFKKRLRDDFRGENFMSNSDLMFDGEDYSEYLCKSWSKFVKHRVIFTKNTDMIGDQKSFTAHVVGNVRRNFIICEKGVVFMD